MAATMKDIARATGLGLATISKYFNGGQVRPENRALIEQAAATLRYTPNDVARSLKTNHTKTIGVVIPELNNAFIMSIITTMEDILRKQNYATIVCDCRSDAAREAEAVAFLMHKRVDGLINMPTCTTGEHLTGALGAGIPVVLVDRLLEPLSGRVSAVVVDNAAAVDCGASHLIALGHKNIGLILGDTDLYTTRCRKQGYLQALCRHGIEAREDLIRHGGYTFDGGYQALKALLAVPEKPTAVIITNFEMTLGGMILLNEARVRVPRELSVIGFDKLDLFGGLFPDLTLITQPQNAIGEQAARLMLTHVSDETFAPRVVTLDTRLLKRGSTASVGDI